MTDETATGATMETTDKVSPVEAIGQFANVLSDTRQEIQAVEQELATLNGERMRVEAAPPHTDDIVAAFKRGLDEAGKVFKQQVGRHLNSANARDGKAAVSVARGRGQFLTVDREPGAVPGSSSSSAGLLPGRWNVAGDALSVAAVTYFLRDRIAAEIPQLVAEMCPGSDKGMKETDRKAALRSIEEQVAAKKVRLDELRGIVAKAQDALYPRN